MTAVVGIDAAWTAENPSGVALAARAGPNWRLIAATPSCSHFLGRAREERPRGGALAVAPLLDRAAALAGAPVSLVAVDMPLSTAPIVGRRACDNAVSRAFGAMKCATHSPSALRPGALADVLRAEFEAAGYPLACSVPLQGAALIEVYPHPAIVRLTGAAERLPYKFSRLRAYWPDMFRQARLDSLGEVWSLIIDRLDEELAGAGDLLRPPPDGAPVWAMKAFEDALDAAVCAWIGVCALEGRARAYGDATSAIWIPLPPGDADAGSPVVRRQGG